MRSSSVMLALVLCGCAGSGGPSFDWERFASPAPGDGPWVRWWWPGGDVDDGELAREVRLMAQAGFAGAEIQALDAALDPKAGPEEIARRRSWGSAEFFDRVRAAMAAAEQAGLQLDLTIGSGWPVGGPFVEPGRSLRTLVMGEHRVQGPGTVTLDLSRPDRPFFYDLSALAEAIGEEMARYVPELASLRAVVAARVTGGARDPNPAVMTDTVLLDRASVTVLTDRVGPDSRLHWDCPEGEFAVLAFYSMPTGDHVVLDAYPGEAWVVDHLDAASVDQALRELVGPVLGSGRLHGIFNDSLEFKAERLFTSDFIEEFARRRGYDPTPWLPVVMSPGADNFVFSGGGFRVEPPYSFGPDDERVRYDWERTASDLFRERFLRRTRAFAASHGLAFRSQNYGMSLDVIGASGDVDVPEAEQLYAGGADVFLKLVASGAHLYDRPVVSAESLVWQGRDYMTTPLKVKAAADKAFAAGINRLVFHGFPYRKTGPEYGAVGWHPFSSPFSGGTYSTMVGEADPFWRFMPDVNRYCARVQHVLRSGRNDADLLVYWPWLGIPGAIGFLETLADEPLVNGRFEGEPKVRNPGAEMVTEFMGGLDMSGPIGWVAGVWPVLADLWSRGWTFDFVNDESLALAEARDGRVHVRGSSYKAVLLLDAPWLDASSAEALGRVARGGVPVLVAGREPARHPGLDVAADESVRSLVREVGVLEAGQVMGRLAELGVRATVLGGVKPLVRRLGPESIAVFLANQAGEAVAWRVDVEGGCEEPLLADPLTGRVVHADVGADGRVAVELPGHGSVLLFCGVEGPKWAEAAGGEDEGSVEEVRPWLLSVDGTDGGVSVVLDELRDWRDIDGLRYASGVGRYEASWRCAALPGQAFLELDSVFGAAEVRVNGQAAGIMLFPPWRVDVTGLLRPGDNRIEVALIPPARNGLVGKGDQPGYGQFAGKDDTLVAAGLVGRARIRWMD